MKIDAGLVGELAHASTRAQALEAQGFDGLVTAELSSDPFFPLLLAAESTERVDLMTSIAVGFSSTRTAERPLVNAASPQVPLPAKKSRTVSPGRE